MTYHMRDSAPKLCRRPWWRRAAIWAVCWLGDRLDHLADRCKSAAYKCDAWITRMTG